MKSETARKRVCCGGRTYIWGEGQALKKEQIAGSSDTEAWVKLTWKQIWELPTKETEGAPRLMCKERPALGQSPCNWELPVSRGGDVTERRSIKRKAGRAPSPLGGQRWLSFQFYTENPGLIPFKPYDTEGGGASCTVRLFGAPTALRVQFGAHFWMSLGSSFTEKIYRNDPCQTPAIRFKRSQAPKPADGKLYRTNDRHLLQQINYKNRASIYKFKKQKSHLIKCNV